MALQFQGRQVTGQAMLDRDLRDLYFTDGPGGGYLCAATGNNGGLCLFTLTPGGGLQLVDTAYFADLPGDLVSTRIDLLTIGGTTRLLAGADQGGLVSYDLDGAIGAQSGAGLPGLSAWCAATAGDATPVVFALQDTGGTLGAYELTGSGASLIGEASGAIPQGPVQMTSFLSGGDPVLIVADGGATGPGTVVSYRLSMEHGLLQPVGQAGAAEGLSLSVPSAVEVVFAHGSAWVILGSAGGHTLTVLEVADSGALTPADQLMDTGETRFGGVMAVTAAGAGEQVFVFAAGADDGISVFSLLPDGRLVHLQSLADDTGLGLQNVTALQAVTDGDVIRLFAGAQGGPGLSEFAWSVARTGIVADQQGGTLSGTADEDVLFARGADPVTIQAGAGDDILVAASGVLTGGGGDDIFVLRPGGDLVTITDFNPARDRLDLSHLPMLRNPGQLGVTVLENGVQLDHGATRIRVESATGDPLTFADLWPMARFSTPDRTLSYGPPVPGQVITGTDGADSLTGGAGGDEVRGKSGADLLRGLAGDDVLYGQGDADDIRGGAGRDTVHAGPGNDLVSGGKGADRVHAGQGRDMIEGGPGRDRIWGHGGKDTITGGAGADTLYGGGAGDVFVFAPGHGADRIADFTPGRDLIEIHGPGLGFGDLTLQAEPGGVEIDTLLGSVSIDGLSPDQISAADFLFL